ncbi:MAG: hypothetical protein N2449_06390 [Bacteroidales bacterium]|nr:hypothetical protein [Bacteroidales bacterium]
MVTLEEGKEYNFFVEKLISLPDGKYFILIDDWGRKYLLPQQYYIDYPIQEKKNIICNVNKINCNGKIFLEPQHPIYRLNDMDKFTLTSIQQRIKQRTGEPYYVVLAYNDKTNKAVVINYQQVNVQNLPQQYICKVVKIKKAELQLEAISIL